MACRTRTPKKRHLKGSKYKLRNWKEYNLSLKKRGSLEIWIEPGCETKWYYSGNRNPGGKVLYSDLAITMNLSIRQVYHQPLRQTQGMVESIVKLMGLNVSVPDHTVVSRRAKKLGLSIERFLKNDNENQMSNKKVYMIIDSTGLKIYGEGEWASGKHKTKVKRAWRKLHISVDQQGDIQAASLTNHRTDDASQIPNLQSQVMGPVDGAIADGGYDAKSVYQSFLAKNPNSRLIIPPRKQAVLSDDIIFKQRNKHLDYIHKNGRAKWEERSGYTKQSRIENTMFRYKTIIGRKLRSRTFDRQQREVFLSCSILNKMASLGMPDSYKVSA